MRPRPTRTDRALIVPAALLSTLLFGLLLSHDATALPDTGPAPAPGEPGPPAPDPSEAHGTRSAIPTIGLVVSLLASLGAVLWIRRL